jgi:general stress protein YciG
VLQLIVLARIRIRSGRRAPAAPRWRSTLAIHAGDPALDRREQTGVPGCFIHGFTQWSTPMAQQHGTTSSNNNPGNFANDREKAAEAGRKGGQQSHGGGGAENNPGNFANDREKAAEAGRKGGQNSHGGGGAEHNPGNFANDREKAAEAGRKGGQNSHGGQSTGE